MGKIIFIVSLLFNTIGFSQQSTTSINDFNNTQNNILGTQGRSFGGGSLIKPNPILTSADFAFIQNPTFEGGWRYGTGLGFSKINMGSGLGVNSVLTFDLTQQTYSLFYTRNDWYFHLNGGKMGFVNNMGFSVTKLWEFDNIFLGLQLGNSILKNKDPNPLTRYFASVPYFVFLTEKEFTITKKIDWKPESFFTICSPYYDMGKKFFSRSNTANIVIGNNISYSIFKKFKFNIDWRMNINTTPKFGIMNNILIGTNLKF